LELAHQRHAELSLPVDPKASVQVFLAEDLGYKLVSRPHLKIFIVI
jgi:hypothetical protein